jgi:uncharacterized membrane protein YphA (DoxX/SURF4 family)
VSADAVRVRDRRGAVAPWVGLLARLVLGGVFLVAGGLKALDPSASIRAVTAYELLPVPVAEIVGYALPWLEIGLAVLLLVGLLTRAAAATLGLLLVAFIIGVSSAWARGLSIDCGCFGGGGTVAPDQTAYVSEILRDVGLLLCAAWLVVRPATRLAVDSDHRRLVAPIATLEPEEQ